MEAVTVSSKYQIIIPLKIRKEINAKPGQQFWVINDDGIIRLIPKLDIKELFGSMKGMNTNFERDEEDRI